MRDTPPMLAPSAEGSRTYDLFINAAGRTLYWGNSNHGVTLGNDSIAWTMDGAAITKPYGEIAAVHLDSTGEKITTDRCTISFADGSGIMDGGGLLIVNTDAAGHSNAERAVHYRDFVHDLHARLDPNRYPGIRFTAGVPRWRYLLMLGSAIALAPVFAVVGLGGYYFFGMSHGGMSNGPALFLCGAFFCWRLGRHALANAPRDYTPDRLPDNLLT